MYCGQSLHLHNRWMQHILLLCQLRCVKHQDYSLLYRTTPKSELKSKKDRETQERALIQEFRPPWNYQGNERFYNPKAGLSCIDFCLETHLYSCFYDKSKRTRWPLRETKFAIGSIPPALIPYHSDIRRLKLDWPFTSYDIDDAEAEAIEAADWKGRQRELIERSAHRLRMFTRNEMLI